MDHVYSLLRFRLGAHDLRVATGRWGQCPTARASRGARLCERCDLGLVEDEFHVVFECPFYAPVRERFAILFSEYSHNWEHVAEHVRSDGLELKRFMQQDVKKVAAFVHAFWKMRTNPDLDPAIILSGVQSALESSDVVESVSDHSEDGDGMISVEADASHGYSLGSPPHGPLGGSGVFSFPNWRARCNVR